MKRSTFIILIAASLLLFLITSQNRAIAQQENFVISPPPIPWYEFNKGQIDLKPGGTYVNVSNDDGDVSLNGGGFNLTSRYAFADQFAVDFMFNYMYIGGDTGGGSSADVNFISWNPNFELQAFKNEKYDLIFFLGYTWVIVPLTFYPASSDAVAVTAYIEGIQFGAQLSILAGNFSIAPFFLFQSMSGDALVNGDTWVDVPTQTVTTFGVDVAYIPYSITLSGLLQSISSDSDFTVIYISVSRNFQWDIDNEPEKETMIKPEKETKAKKKQK